MHIFIYGTLKQGKCNVGVINALGGVFIQTAVTKELRELRVDGLPYLSATTGAGFHVHGEIWEVPEESIPRLDDFEGHPGWYHRTVITVVGDDKVEHDASAYLQDYDAGKVVKNYE